MSCGVVYKFKPHNKINGTLFYCFEYFKFLEKYTDVAFYIVDIADSELQLVYDIFSKKYKCDIAGIVPIKTLDLYKLNLTKTVILDVDTFYRVKEFLTNDIHCFSNDTHPMFRYKNTRSVTYYGSYRYQRYDVFSYLKLNFEIFSNITSEGSCVFISSLDQKIIQQNINRWTRLYPDRDIILKKSHAGIGNLFDVVNHVHYVHTSRDTNNRIIPEAFYYNKQITIEDMILEEDSVQLRYNDIASNGLSNYTISENDEIIKACLR
jgi:hypothetical protein